MTPHPDDHPDKLSELVTIVEGITGIPTAIPTKCRDSAGRALRAGGSRQTARRNGGILIWSLGKRES